MPDESTLRKQHGVTVKSVIYGFLALQLALAVMLMGGDLWRALPAIGMPSTQPRFDQPVNPGDQTRRYRPADMPLAPAREGKPARRFTSTGDMPTRLVFEAQGQSINMTGAISPGDAERFDSFLESGSAVFETVHLNSPGGSVSDALVIGQRLRDEGVNTVMRAGDICLSACPYILAGGVARTIDDDAQVGMHQHFFDVNTILPAFLAVEDVQRGQGTVMMHLEAMGVDPLVMQHALVTPPDEIYILLHEQLELYRFAFLPDSEVDETSETE